MLGSALEGLIECLQSLLLAVRFSPHDTLPEAWFSPHDAHAVPGICVLSIDRAGPVADLRGLIAAVRFSPHDAPLEAWFSPDDAHAAPSTCVLSMDRAGLVADLRGLIAAARFPPHDAPPEAWFSPHNAHADRGTCVFGGSPAAEPFVHRSDPAAQVTYEFANLRVAAQFVYRGGHVDPGSDRRRTELGHQS